MAKKFNVLLIASHHGFFLTLKSLERFKKEIDKLVVIIPEEKIQKYGKMEGDEFQNFQNLILTETKKVKKTSKIYTARFDLFRRLSQTAEFLKEIKAAGIWLQAPAGSVINRLPTNKVLEEMDDQFLLMSSIRCYEGNKQLNMYMMLGQTPLDVHEKQNMGTFIMNADKIPSMILPDLFMIKEAQQRGVFKSASPFAFSTDEELVEHAFAGKQLIDHASKAAECVVADYWSIVMASNPSIDHIFGYPLELYLPFVDDCVGLIPAITLHRIKKNANETKEYSLAFREALS